MLDVSGAYVWANEGQSQVQTHVLFLYIFILRPIHLCWLEALWANLNAQIKERTWVKSKGTRLGSRRKCADGRRETFLSLEPVWLSLCDPSSELWVHHFWRIVPWSQRGSLDTKHRQLYQWGRKKGCTSQSPSSQLTPDLVHLNMAANILQKMCKSGMAIT